MQVVSPLVIDQIRNASRTLVREFGFMGRNLASTHLPPSALHTLLEIDIKGPQTAAELCVKLNLEKSSVSRMLKKLVDGGEIEETAIASDGRRKQLRLTEQGRQTVNAAHRFARHQVLGALQSLSPQMVETVVTGLAAYAGALATARQSQRPTQAPAIRIVTGYQPGAIGRIASMFSVYFACHSHFGQYFERKVATELAEFTDRLQSPENQLWLLMSEDQVLGSIAIDGEDLKGDRLAHLRWFFIDERLSGQGFGKQLLELAIQFCQSRNFSEIHLWTVKGLGASSHLYDRYGFIIEQEWIDDQWGTTTTEQKRVKKL